MSIGAELGGAAGARAPPLFTPRPEIYSMKCAMCIGMFLGVKIPQNSP